MLVNFCILYFKLNAILFVFALVTQPCKNPYNNRRQKIKNQIKKDKSLLCLCTLVFFHVLRLGEAPFPRLAPTHIVYCCNRSESLATCASFKRAMICPYFPRA